MRGYDKRKERPNLNIGYHDLTVVSPRHVSSDEIENLFVNLRYPIDLQRLLNSCCVRCRAKRGDLRCFSCNFARLVNHTCSSKSPAMHHLL